MWSEREEEVLAAASFELVVQGWKFDNGFRAGYLPRLEETLRKQFHSSDLLACPHITSKISAWKKSYNSLHAILARSGVGFNVHGDHKIDCEDEQWDQIVQSDHNVRFMLNKSWPLWEKWQVIFGKDRACGGGSENVDHAATAVHSDIVGETQPTNNYYNVSFEDFMAEDTIPVEDAPENPDDSTGHSQNEFANTKSNGMKRKNNSSDGALMEFLGKLHAETNSRLEVISSRIGYEFDLGQSRQKVFNMLGSVEGLSMDQRYELCDILADKSQRLEIFMGMPMEAKPGYVLRLIEQNRKST